MVISWINTCAFLSSSKLSQSSDGFELDALFGLSFRWRGRGWLDDRTQEFKFIREMLAGLAPGRSANGFEGDGPAGGGVKKIGAHAGNFHAGLLGRKTCAHKIDT